MHVTVRVPRDGSQGRCVSIIRVDPRFIRGSHPLVPFESNAVAPGQSVKIGANCGHFRNIATADSISPANSWEMPVIR